MKDTCDKHHKEDCMACFYTTPPIDMTTLKQRFEEQVDHCTRADCVDRADILSFLRQELLALADRMKDESKKYVSSDKMVSTYTAFKDAEFIIRSEADELV